MLPLSGMLFGLPALVVALFPGLKRFYFYSLLTVGLPFLGAWLNVETYIPIITLGVVVLGFGITLLSNFIRTHPTEDREGSNGSGK